jgi:hypothetical protein
MEVLAREGWHVRDDAVPLVTEAAGGDSPAPPQLRAALLDMDYRKARQPTARAVLCAGWGGGSHTCLARQRRRPAA